MARNGTNPATRLAALLAALLACGGVAAETVTVAVASNFANAMRGLVDDFEAKTGHGVRVVPGSSGKLYAQIVNGAPFDVFLSADSERPGRLEREGRIVDGSRQTYALGQLVIWSADPGNAGDCLSGLESPGQRKVAIANPLLAPYGLAAREFLEKRGLWERIGPNLVTGENVAQAAQFTATRNASIGLFALSQARQMDGATCSWIVPDDEYSPIAQQLVMLERASDSAAAIALVEFLLEDGVQERLERLGYRRVSE